MRRPRGIRLLVATALIGLGAPDAARPQAPVPASQAPFTPAQAALGAAVYEAACAECHRPGLEGSSEAPALAGPSFRGVWARRPAAQLLEYLRLAMPPSGPGSLTDAEYAEVAAYLLEQNGAAPSSAIAW